VVKQLHPRARDAAQRRIKRITVGIVAAGIAGTLGIGAGIAIAAPPPKHNNKTDYGAKSKKKPASTPTKAPQPQADAPPVNNPPAGNKPQNNKPAPPPPPQNDKPESSSGDEDTTSGGS
jgi:hypothetical protein